MKLRNLFSILLAFFFLLFFSDWMIKFLTISYLIINILSYVYSKILFENIEIYHKKNIIRSYKNHNIEIELTLKNKSFLQANYLFIKDNTGLLSLKESGKFLIRLNKFGKINLSYFVNAYKRGLFIIGPIKINGSDPLGFYPWEKTINSFSQIIIYPDIYKFFINIREGIPVGIIKSSNKIYEDTTLFKTVREYINGDDLKRINWKISAKMNKLHTMEYEYSLNSTVMILLNLNLNDFPLRYRFNHSENAIEIASSLVFYFTNQKQNIGLISNGKINNKYVYFPIKNGHNHAVMILESLAMINTSEAFENLIGMIAGTKIQLPGRTRIILITPKISMEELFCFYQFKKDNLLFDVFLLSEEKTNLNHDLKKRLGIDLYYYKIDERKIIYEKTSV
ncbi:MAG: DUF58 domain-containing protein [Spirochaetes bacterium]|nr:DUF58 domain-containing protein [Spirochaetota bacterium]